MSQPFVGEIRMVGFTFPPNGWALCAGQLMAISQNDVLFALIGTTYGGDGVQTFQLPDMRGRAPVHPGPGFVQGQISGTEQVTLVTANLPSHGHPWSSASTPGTTTDPTGAIIAGSSTNPYVNAGASAAFGGSMVSQAGNGLPHDNMMPFLAVTFAISLFGIFPSRN